MTIIRRNFFPERGMVHRSVTRLFVTRENSAGKYFTIYGAPAMLLASRDFKAPSSLASYNAPNRRWYYDASVKDRNPAGLSCSPDVRARPWTLK